MLIAEYFPHLSQYGFCRCMYIDCLFRDCSHFHSFAIHSIIAFDSCKNIVKHIKIYFDEMNGFGLVWSNVQFINTTKSLATIRQFQLGRIFFVILNNDICILLFLLFLKLKFVVPKSVDIRIRDVFVF